MLGDLKDVNPGMENVIKYIYKRFESNNEIIRVKTGKSVKELMNDAGYDIYECTCEEDIQSFKKYYKEDEELCTFNGGRLNRCFVYFAIKHNVDNIRREDFDKPERENLYGTSVISIQFSKTTSCLSIKNRYNHTVSNPDSTFSNDLENIIPGLTYAFETELGIEIRSPYQDIGFNIPKNYVIASDNKLYKYNYEYNDTYYCPDNVIIDDAMPIKYDKADYLLVEMVLINLKDKNISLYDPHMSGSFVNKDEYHEGLNYQRSFSSIEIRKEKNSKFVSLNKGEIILEIDNQNRLIGYVDHVTHVCHNLFMFNHSYLKYVNMFNVKIVEDHVLSKANNIEIVNMPNVKKIGMCFLCNVRRGPEVIDFPLCEKIDYSFMKACSNIRVLNLPSLHEINGGSLLNAYQIEDVNSSSEGYKDLIKVIALTSLIEAKTGVKLKEIQNKPYMLIKKVNK